MNAQTPSIITIILKDESRTIRQKHLVYETYCAHPNEPIIKDLIEETKKNFDGDPTDITIRIAFEVL